MLDVTDQINDPKQNVIDQSFSGSTGLLMDYGQSFLREEVGKMYRGEFILRGIPEIEPMDVLLLMDPSTGMLGPIEVETVTHVINTEMGYVTVVKPRAVVCVNEAASANFFRMLLMAMGTIVPEVRRIGNLNPGIYILPPNKTSRARAGGASTQGAYTAQNSLPAGFPPGQDPGRGDRSHPSSRT